MNGILVAISYCIPWNYFITWERLVTLFKNNVFSAIDDYR